MEEHPLAGRCGTCGFFKRMTRKESGGWSGECRLGCWPAPLSDTATCSSYKAVGTAWTKQAPPRKARRGRSEPRAPRQKPALPKEIDLDMDTETFRRTLAQVLDDALGLSDETLGDRWVDGELVLQPADESLQAKRVPIETFFKKLTAVREKLRVLEQKINGAEGLSTAERATLQGYITSCYGSLTTFNVLFRDREDGFVGQSKKG